MVLSENLAEIVVQLAPKTREVAQQFQAELNQLQLLVGRLRKDVDARALDKRKFEKELEEGLRNIAALSQREQELIKRYERDRERAATLDDVRSRKRERLEKHTLNMCIHTQLKMVPAGLKQSLNLFAKWAGLQVVPAFGGYRLCLTLLDRQQPHRCCSLLLRLDSKGNYEASECEPALNSLGELIAELRQTRNLSRFVKLLRRQFQGQLQLLHQAEATG
uniref:Kinetochore protein SPC25 n=2 Tax=Amblyomma TaxID=6942 RepID=G3MTM2_AMBMU